MSRDRRPFGHRSHWSSLPGTRGVPAMTPDPTGGIFLSYRREEAGYAAGRLADRIATKFGSTRVFIDVDSIPRGRTSSRPSSEPSEAVTPYWLSSVGSGLR